MRNPWKSKAEPTKATDSHLCGECVVCRATTAGAQTICALIGVDYDTLDATSREHYGLIAQEVMTAMSEVIAADSEVHVVNEAAHG